ncbi:MAG: Hpt domain-containing protein [Fusobacteriaceae bacterium]|nr:Hpt domain-containing protein [Fusobacteriaceae bacterium]MBN2837686.1 Hpt domain-containing protein [Fusobacteriaceae bacterium]
MDKTISDIINGKYNNNKGEELDLENLNEFKEEVLEILDHLEEKLLGLEKKNFDNETLKYLYRSFHSIKGIAGFASQSIIENIAHESETVLSKLENNILKIDIIIFEVLINSVEIIKELCKDLTLEKDGEFKKLIQTHFTNLRNLGVKKYDKIDSLDDLLLANEEFIKVPLKKLDDLACRIEAIRELSQNYKKENSNNYINELEKNLLIIEGYIEKYRASEIRNLYDKLEKVINYNMRVTGIEANIIYKGSTIIVDKNIQNKLLIPFSQIIRNALTHGFKESDKKNVITISTEIKDNYFYFEIKNNGKEIDIERINKKIKERGLRYEGDKVMEAIFLPGFTTLDKANKISGRGIGLDVVKSEIEKLNGKISVYSETNHETKFIIKLPKDKISNCNF